MSLQSKRKYCLLCYLLLYDRKKVVFFTILVDIIIAAIMALLLHSNYFMTLIEVTIAIVVYLGIAFIIHGFWCKRH
jgi:hypothetical protein